MSDNSTETGTLSMNDAISLLSTPSADNAVEEQPEAEQPQPPETEALLASEETADAPEDDYEDDDVYEGEDADEDEGQEEYEEEQLYTVKIDGEEHSVTLDELQNGYSRQQAFTKRSMELAEQRKAFEAEAEQTKALRDAYKQHLDVLQNQIQQTTQAEPDWRALAEQGYSEKELFLAKAEYDKNQQEAVRIQQEQQRIAQEQAAENQHKMREHLEMQRQDMLNRIPQWQDEERRSSERLEVIKFANKMGFSEEEIANASDARAIHLLHMAWQMDKLKQKAPDAKKRTKKAPKMAKAGTPKTKQQVASRSRQQAMQRLNKERSIDSAVDFLMSR